MFHISSSYMSHKLKPYCFKSIRLSRTTHKCYQLENVLSHNHCNQLMWHKSSMEKYSPHRLSYRNQHKILYHMLMCNYYYFSYGNTHLYMWYNWRHLCCMSSNCPYRSNIHWLMIEISYLKDTNWDKPCCSKFQWNMICKSRHCSSLHKELHTADTFSARYRRRNRPHTYQHIFV